MNNFGFMSSLRMMGILALSLVVSACASGANTGAMTASMSTESLGVQNSKAHNAIALGDVTGGSETSPLWKSRVSNENFRDALSQSLKLNLLLATQAEHYRLDAELVDLDQPNMGFDIEVTAKVHYKLTELASGNKIIDDTITTPHTTDMSDAFMGTERLRLANEGAMRDNIQALIGKIFSAFSKQQ